MTDTPVPARRSGGLSAARLLQAMLAAQCLLAVFVVAADLPPGFVGNLLSTEPRSPSTEVPVTPGNQTRRFEPRRLPAVQPTGPDFPSQEFVSPRLEFEPLDLPGRTGAVLLTGSIAPGDATRFGTWLQERDDPPGAIALHSPGGSVQDALEIGRLIRAAGVPVVVVSGASCFSACPYVLAGGAVREVSRGAFIGVHQHYFGENTYLPAFLLVSDIQVGQGEVMAYLAEMGIDPMLMAKALVTPPDEIYILTPDELDQFRLATALND